MAARLHSTSSRKEEWRYVRYGHWQGTTSSESRNAASRLVDDGTGTRGDDDRGAAGTLRCGAAPRNPDDDGLRRPSSTAASTTSTTEAAAGASEDCRAGAAGAVGK